MNDKAIEIAAATQEDALTLSQIIRESFAGVAYRFDLNADNCPTHPSNCNVEWVLKAMDEGSRYFILSDAGKPCGCAALTQSDPKKCYIQRLSIVPEFRRHGLGEALVKHLANEARQLGAENLKIALIAKHTELRDWYADLGFTVERESVTYEKLPFEVTFMSLAL